ncbi:hypothetical protein EV13_2794 [Prochlorococcus sp. MIT 0702]|nr:hypothetical protein EV13_2794 [Prochlorococcus sp. MIT 0702]
MQNAPFLVWRERRDHVEGHLTGPIDQAGKSDRQFTGQYLWGSKPL